MNSKAQWLCIINRLLYTPCKDCSGLETIFITLTENQTDPDIPVSDSPVKLTIDVVNVNDPPTVFVTQYGHSIMQADPTEPIKVTYSQPTR